MNSLSVALRAGYLSVRTAEGAPEKQSSLKVRLRNGLTYLLTYLHCNLQVSKPQESAEIVFYRLDNIIANEQLQNAINSNKKTKSKTSFRTANIGRY